MSFRLVEDGVTVGQFDTLEAAMLAARPVRFWSWVSEGYTAENGNDVRVLVF